MGGIVHVAGAKQDALAHHYASSLAHHDHQAEGPGSCSIEQVIGRKKAQILAHGLELEGAPLHDLRQGPRVAAAVDALEPAAELGEDRQCLAPVRDYRCRALLKDRRRGRHLGARRGRRRGASSPSAVFPQPCDGKAPGYRHRRREQESAQGSKRG